MAQQRSVEIRVGLFVLICLAVVAGLIVKFGKLERFSAKTYDITVVFANVGGLVRDANVMYAGLSVGKVSNIGLTEAGGLKAKVTLTIYEGCVIRNDAKFVINTAGLLGDRYVDVIPQSATAKPIKPGETLEGSPSVDLTEAIRSIVDVLHQAAGTIARIDDAVKRTDEAIKRIDDIVLTTQSLARVSSALANVDAVTSNTVALTLSLREVVDENRGVISNAAARLSLASENVITTTKRVDDLVLANEDEINAAVKNVTDSTQRLNAILEQLQKGEGTAGKLLVDSTLHDELVRLVQNWRQFGLLYKEGPARQKPKTAAPPAKSAPGGLIFGTDETKPTN